METQRHEDTKIIESISAGDAPHSLEMEQLASAIVDSAFKVHSTLGAGLIESVYESCLCHELSKGQIPFRRQVAFINFNVRLIKDGIKRVII